MRALLMFCAGFSLAFILFTASPLAAQNTYPTMPADAAAYVEQAANQLEILSSFAMTTSNFIDGNNTEKNLASEEKNLDTLIKDVSAQEPSIELLALHTQLRFAASRCRYLSSVAKSLRRSMGLDAIALVAPFTTERAVCASEINLTRLRLIDYAAQLDMARQLGALPPRPAPTPPKLTTS